MRLLGLALAVAIAPAAWAPTTALAYGEPTEYSKPNHQERLLHVLTNQVRAEPHAWPDWDTSLATAEARQPLALHNGLFAAARFHADDMAMNNFFAHESFDGTPFSTRVDRYFAGPAGENIYFGPGGARGAVTAWMNSAGHRVNILRGSWNLLGTGNTTQYHVQDFGEAGNVTQPAIPGGAIETIGNGKMRLIANWFDRQSRAPMSFEATLGEQTIALEQIAGPRGNATYQALADFPGECTRFFFTAIDQSGNKTVYPTTGALLAGRTCTSEFDGEPAKIDDRPIIDAQSTGCRCVAPTKQAGAGSVLVLMLGLITLFPRRKR